MCEYNKGLALKDYIQQHKEWEEIHRLLPKGSYHKTYYALERNTVECSIYNKGGLTIAQFALLILPNSSSLTFSYGAWLLESFRGMGVGRLLREIKDDAVLYPGSR